MLAVLVELPPGIDVLVKSVLALYIVVNPSGVSSTFLGLTRSLPRAQRVRVAFRAVLTGGLILAAFALAGGKLFAVFKITGASLQIAGGILVFGFAYALVRGREHQFFGDPEQAAEEGSPGSVAYYPLAVPLIAGPASITVVTTLSAEAPDPVDQALLLSAIGGVAFLCFLSMMRVLRLAERLGAALHLIAPRLMGLVLAVIAVQIVIGGVGKVLPDLKRRMNETATERSS
ncbi:MAG: MarC family protein [Planctomycetota bacterium]